MSRLNDLYPSRFPLLPLKNVVIFPRNIVTLLVGRPRSIQAVDDALARDRRLVVTAHRESDIDDPLPEDLHAIGTLAAIVSTERQPSGSVQVVLEGLQRARLGQFDLGRGCYTVAAELLLEPDSPPAEAHVLITHVQDLASRYGDVRGAMPAEVQDMVQRASDPSHLADLLATQLLTDVSRRQALLEMVDPLRRLESVAVQLSADIDVAALERRIKERVRDQIDKNQREYYLREQLKAIHDELGGEAGNEIEALKKTINERGLPDYVADKLLKEVARLERMPAISAEATVVRTYVDTMLALPWTKESTDRIDIAEAERILNDDHYGLETVKERILDFLAVRKLTHEAGGTTRAQILCFVGPPGVGKTSLGRSIARAMDREFVRVSLGGVRDEAEIRGHRRTYIGAMPGKIINAIKQAGTTNPVILLDEIDKMTSDYRGDPASAMLEVLDPEQNNSFMDHFLDVTYDLSKILFITTANYWNQIPRPLRDRMEVIDVSGYTEAEKIEIGRRHLLARQIEGHGLKPGSVEIPAKSWAKLVRGYTREAGVRQLEREVAAICRRVAREVVRGRTEKMRVTEGRLADYLGPARFGQDMHLGEHQVGLAIGLGVTEVGGELLPVEVATMPGNGNLTITGKAGEVMQESARAALSYARSRAAHLRIDPEFQSTLDLHIHLPEGATPKDGPSAGITMATALISALTRLPVRGDIAMTGEITLRGRVLAIGGLKDKVLAAHRQGIRRVLAPKDNERDLPKIPANIRKEIELVFVSTMDEVIAHAIHLDDVQMETLLEGSAAPQPAPATDAVLPGYLPADAPGNDVAADIPPPDDAYRI
ncbi:MAG TPA: endopeptidase La [Thermomicrobiales bacterium]|nr:endopeptidase La [Thermomicrobiales bacterium]